MKYFEQPSYFIRSAIPANNLYLEFFGKGEPGRLSRPNTAKGSAELQLEQPVHIHPTAQIDPSAKVCFLFLFSLWQISLERINVLIDMN